MSSYACAREGCGATVCFTAELEERLRRTHEWWVCPFGHRQHFSAATAEEIELRNVRRTRDRYIDLWREVEQTFGTCPMCGWRSRSGIERRWLYLLRHFDKVHRDQLRESSLTWLMRRHEAGEDEATA